MVTTTTTVIPHKYTNPCKAFSASSSLFVVIVTANKHTATDTGTHLTYYRHPPWRCSRIEHSKLGEYFKMPFNKSKKCGYEFVALPHTHQAHTTSISIEAANHRCKTNKMTCPTFSVAISRLLLLHFPNVRFKQRRPHPHAITFLLARSLYKLSCARAAI